MCLFIRTSLKWLLLFSISTIFIFYTLVVNLNNTTRDNLISRYTKTLFYQMNIKKVVYDKFLFVKNKSNKKKE